ncbi:hypothetical protein K443DRAFT_355796 [Laccaria amethystina LaAM-08-1]|uniref:Uncharacterized protein n=1 Tax=Laccaria amethystina LaAM-08-1 TaxID=1095629 RepID=A0A0C9WJE9_9AGAR|nr:hypothetical protein K443DRAFT_355796 [Laccaria amethystina LaAM-08-1]
MPPATPKSATVLPPSRTPTKSGLRSSSPPLSKTGARGTNSNAAQPVSNEKGAPVQTRPQVQTRAAPARTNASSGTTASYKTNALTSNGTTTLSFYTTPVPLHSQSLPSHLPSTLTLTHPSTPLTLPRHLSVHAHNTPQSSECVIPTHSPFRLLRSRRCRGSCRVGLSLLCKLLMVLRVWWLCREVRVRGMERSLVV